MEEDPRSSAYDEIMLEVEEGVELAGATGSHMI